MKRTQNAISRPGNSGSRSGECVCWRANARPQRVHVRHERVDADGQGPAAPRAQVIAPDALPLQVVHARRVVAVPARERPGAAAALMFVVLPCRYFAVEDLRDWLRQRVGALGAGLRGV